MIAPDEKALLISSAKKRQRPSNETRLVEAAIRCLKKYGSAKTYIEDIAKEAGLSRQTAYRTFATRQDLFDKVVASRVADMVDILRPRMKGYKSFEEALVSGSIDAVQAAKNDPVFQQTLEAAGYHGLDRILLKEGINVFQHFETVWRDILTQARATGKIRQNLSDSDVFEYMRLMQVFLISKEDISDGEQRDFLTKFMIPALQA